MKKILEDKIIAITGSRRGIGQGCVKSLLNAGACVVGCATGPDEENENKIIPDFDTPPNDYFYKRCNVSVAKEMEDFINWTLEKFKRIDCLVNNAGVHPPTLRIDDFLINDFEELLRINLISMFIACKAVLPSMRKNKGSSIINMGSLVGHTGQEGATIYCATKGAISAFTKALAIDEGKYGIRINAILPGTILTPSTRAWSSVFKKPESKMREIDSWNWLNRQGEPKEVGDAVVFLASNMSSYITGHELFITGGAELGYGVKTLIKKSRFPEIENSEGNI